MVQKNKKNKKEENNNDSNSNNNNNSNNEIVVEEEQQHVETTMESQENEESSEVEAFKVENVGGEVVVEEVGGGGEEQLIVEQEDQYSSYRWHLNGKKRLKRSGLQTSDTFRKYFRCAQAYHPNKAEGCKAAYWQDFNGENGGNIQMTHSEHNHPPPKSQRVPKDTWSKLKAMVASGAKPSEIQRLLGKDSQDSTSPSRKQIENMTSRMKKAKLPSGSAQKNMIEYYGSFVKLMELHPQINIVCMSEDAKNFLVDVQTLILDSNVEITEDKVYLNTFIAKCGDNSFPFGWFITNSKTESNYLRMYSFIRDLTLGKMHAPIIVCSCDTMVRSVAQQTFGLSPVEIIGSFSSFFSENWKKFEQSQPNTNISNDTKSSLEQSLRALYESEEEKIEENLAIFESDWSSYQDYILSFQETWTKSNVETWANLQRISDTSHDSPNVLLESWQLRQQKIVDDLKDQDNIYEKVVKALLDEWNDYAK
eukprot:TRINITY_DN10315_c0_g1_i1.p1 TRINITY_DN10315_c0_g1~~TRINITY_DN10315_c0_g1_i1.p1  ORF type:complete len:479 (-),score=179.65 TRINITY_DN10315_c0_g1_i1:87-1523(-)